MLRRYWLSYLAAVGILLAQEPYTYAAIQGVARDHRAEQFAAKPQSYAAPALPVAVQNDIHAIATALDSVKKQIPTDREKAEQKANAQRNLKYQKLMGRSAANMFWVGIAESIFTLCEIIVTAAGVTLVFFTLRHTRTSAEAATTTAAQAILTTSEAKRQADAAEAGLRPHVFVENPRLVETPSREWFNLEDADVEHKQINVVYNLPNYGRSPAIIKTLKGGVYIGTSLPDSPSPNRNDVWTDEIVIPVDEDAPARRKFYFLYRDKVTKALLNDLFISRSFDPDRAPTKCFFWVEVEYEGMYRSSDKFGVLWEFLIDIGRWVQVNDKPEYSYRRLGNKPAD